MRGGELKLIIRAQIDKFNISGGNNLIYIYPVQNTENPEQNKIGKIKISGGRNKIYINSDVDELKTSGGSIKIFCDFQTHKINNLNINGGNVVLNPSQNEEKKINNLINSGKGQEITPTILNNNEIENPCMICLENMVSGDEVYFLPCFHCFHKSCIKSWLEKKEACPKCNLKLIYKLA